MIFYEPLQLAVYKMRADTFQIRKDSVFSEVQNKFFDFAQKNFQLDFCRQLLATVRKKT